MDTHTFLWFITNNARSSESALDAVAEPTIEILVSPASYWEIAIKVGLGKCSLTVPFETFFREGIEGSGMISRTRQRRRREAKRIAK